MERAKGLTILLEQRNGASEQSQSSHTSDAPESESRDPAGGAYSITYTEVS